MHDPYKDLVALATGILECLDHGDLWTKPARKHAAGLLRVTLEAIRQLDAEQADPSPLADEIPGWLLRQQRQNETPDPWGSEGGPV